MINDIRIKKQVSYKTVRKLNVASFNYSRRRNWRNFTRICNFVPGIRLVTLKLIAYSIFLQSVLQSFYILLPLGLLQTFD